MIDGKIKFMKIIDYKKLFKIIKIINNKSK